MKYRSIEELAVLMAMHSRENPSHGYNCACKDRWLWEARRRLQAYGPLTLENFAYIARILIRG